MDNLVYCRLVESYGCMPDFYRRMARILRAVFLFLREDGYKSINPSAPPYFYNFLSNFVGYIFLELNHQVTSTIAPSLAGISIFHEFASITMECVPSAVINPAVLRFRRDVTLMLRASGL